MTQRRTVTFLAIAASLGASNACVSVHAPSFMEPTPRREWPSVLATAQTRVSEGRFDAADSILGQFAGRYPESPEAIETAYWRALFGMDPTNTHGSLGTAVTFLDAYLAGPGARDHRREHQREATALRRVAGQLESLNRSTLALSQGHDAAPRQGDVRIDVPKPVPDPALSADAEIKRLKDELAKANAELERIRRRLTQPPPGKP